MSAPALPRPVSDAAARLVRRLRHCAEVRRVRTRNALRGQLPSVQFAAVDASSHSIEPPSRAVWEEYIDDEYVDPLTAFLEERLHQATTLVDTWTDVHARAIDAYRVQFAEVMDAHDQRRRLALAGLTGGTGTPLRALDAEAALRAARLGRDERDVFVELYLDPDVGIGRGLLEELRKAETIAAACEDAILALCGTPSHCKDEGPLRVTHPRLKEALGEDAVVYNSDGNPYGNRMDYHKGTIDVSADFTQPATAPFETLDATWYMTDDKLAPIQEAVEETADGLATTIARINDARMLSDLVRQGQRLRELRDAADSIDDLDAWLAFQTHSERVVKPLAEVAKNETNLDLDVVDKIVAAEDVSDGNGTVDYVRWTNGLETASQRGLAEHERDLVRHENAFRAHRSDAMPYYAHMLVMFNTRVVIVAKRTDAFYRSGCYGRPTPSERAKAMARRVLADAAAPEYNVRGQAGPTSSLDLVAIWCDADLDEIKGCVEVPCVEADENYPEGAPCFYADARYEGDERESAVDASVAACVSPTAAAMAVILARKRHAHAVRRAIGPGPRRTMGAA